MAIIGWSNYGMRGWGSTTGDESGTIVSDNGSGTTGILTRDQNNGIGDFEYIINIHKATQWGNCEHGGISFGVQDANHFYGLMWTVDTPGVHLCLHKDPVSGSGNTGTLLHSATVNNTDSNSTSFYLKVVKTGSDYGIYFGDANSQTLVYTVNDSSYPTGNIGLLYPSNQWAGNDAEYKFVSITGASTPVQRRRIMVVS